MWLNARDVVGIVLLGAIIVSYFLSSFLQRAISLPILRLADTTKRVSQEKNYALRVEQHGDDELGTLIVGFNEMLGQLQSRDEQLQQQRNQLEGQVTAVREGTYALSSSLQQISASLTQMTSGTAETAVTVSQTATTVEEVKQTAYLANQKAQEISVNSLRTAQVAKVGEQAVEDTIQEMNGVRERMETIACSVMQLGEQSRTIGDIMTTLSSFAEQSNLLAINAEIEAAKAGDAGKGFAVVAQEVRLLAEQSKQATVQVWTMLNDIQQAVQGAVRVTEQGTKATESGVTQSLQAGGSIRALSQSISEAVQAMTQIAALSQQQLQGMDQVATAISTIKEASQRNAEGIKQLESSALGLQETGKTLTALL
jgi:methyl-accepting chemotaxis protein